MPPTEQNNPFPESTLSKIWGTLVNTLQGDAVLGARVKGWRVWDGSDDDLTEPTDTDMPFLALDPTTGTGAWLDEQAHQVTIPVKLTLGVLGTDATALFDFWDAIRAAIYTNQSLLSLLYPYQGIQVTLTVPATQPKQWGQSSGLSGEGALLIKFRVSS